MKKDLKLVRSLSQKKFRQETGLFVVEGRKMVEEALASTYVLHSLYSTDAEFCVKNTTAEQINGREMEQISGLSTPSSHLAVLHQRKEAWPVPSDCNVILALDGISDPGNMGTLIRTAEWFGIEHVLLSAQCVEIYNPKVIQSTMGSIFRIKAQTINWIEELKALQAKGFKVLASDLAGENLFEHSFSPKNILVVGSESHGISVDTEKLMDASIHIPGAGKAESLNAGVAGAIMMSTWFGNQPR